MTRNLSDKPHRTPHPDQPHARGPAKDKNPAPGRSSSDEAESEEPNYDSCNDDLNRLLSESNREPDPNLESAAPVETSSSSSRSKESVAGLVPNPEKVPRTSEVFQAVGPLVADVPLATSNRNERSQSVLSADSPGAIPRVQLTPDRLPTAGLDTADRPNVRGSTDAEDRRGGSSVPWAHLLLLSYSSALTLALIWAVWQGWFKRPPVQQPPDSSPSGLESATKVPPTKPAGLTPPIPTENLATLGKTLQIGELEVTPLSVVMTPLTLVRKFEPSMERHADGSSLVLRLRLTNISKEHTFAPLERGVLRDPISPLDRSYIDTNNGDTISLFPLAIDSEWSIRGEEFPSLKPGESVETIIGSESGAADKLSDEMTWRIRLRIGSYRTDLLGVRFTKDEVLSSQSNNPYGDRDRR